jgi:hypothetical protein
MVECVSMFSIWGQGWTIAMISGVCGCPWKFGEFSAGAVRDDEA